MKSFKTEIKKELFIYFLIFFVFTLIMHSDILTNPLSRIDMMTAKENYSHPFVYSFVLYFILFIIRKFVGFIIGLFEKK
ncbi:MAG: Unknown protein [uncultured Sulfurovum sp.]|uniref:Uncharacterized protein n=1 Tax=uncultured Sulfurovum sp. TaxID=269237 RepID=A0A6S6SS83_9BACT|nr:MAG: Unknown protein [uncultured Sulfurovum sp.]